MNNEPITPKIRAMIAACESAGLGGVSVNISIQELKQLLAENPGDNQDADGTDFAHPAWVRGVDYAIDRVVDRIEAVLDGKDTGAGKLNHARMEALRRRLFAMARLPQATGGA